MLQGIVKLCRRVDDSSEALALMKDSYIITAAHYDETDQALVYVFVGLPPEKADRTVDGMRLYSRQQLIGALKQGKRFLIAHKQRDEGQIEGEVPLLRCGGSESIRADAACIPVDDLGKLAKIRASI